MLLVGQVLLVERILTNAVRILVLMAAAPTALIVIRVLVTRVGKVPTVIPISTNVLRAVTTVMRMLLVQMPCPALVVNVMAGIMETVSVVRPIRNVMQDST